MITLEEAKAHLRIDPSWSGDDEIIKVYIRSATAQVSQLVGYSYEWAPTDDERSVYKAAVLLFVDHFYNASEQANTAAYRLCLQIRNYK